MGALLSRRNRRITVAESTQTMKPPDFKNRKEEQMADAECPVEELTDTYENTPKAFTPTELFGNDAGDACSLLSPESGLTPFTRRQNKRRSGRRAATPTALKTDLSREPGSQKPDANALQYDFLGLPGQVPPSFRTPVKKNSSTGSANDAGYHAAANSPPGNSEPNTDETCPISAEPPQIETPAEMAAADETRPTPLRISFPRAKDIADEDSNISQYSDGKVEPEEETFSGLESGPLFTEQLRNRDLFDDALRTIQGVNSAPLLAQVSAARLVSECEQSAGGDHAANIQRQSRPETTTTTTTTTNDGYGRGIVLGQPNSGSKLDPEFRLSLEQIFQNNVPLHAETMEVATVTGTESAKQMLPQKEDSHVPDSVLPTMVQAVLEKADMAQPK